MRETFSKELLPRSVGEVDWAYADFDPTYTDGDGNLLDDRTIVASPAPTVVSSNTDYLTISGVAVITATDEYAGETIEANTGVMFIATAVAVPPDGAEVIAKVAVTLSDGKKRALNVRFLIEP